MVETESISLVELVEARIQLEVPLAGLAASNATRRDRGSSRRRSRRARDHRHLQASDEFRLADARFHP